MHSKPQNIKRSSTFELNSVFENNTELRQVDYFKVELSKLNEIVTTETVIFPKKTLKPKSSIEQIIKLESYLMDINIERNYNKINDLIAQMNINDISNYRVEETESSFIHLVINKQRSLSIEPVLLEILIKLIEKKCDANIVDAYGWTVLHYCCVYNLQGITKFLLQNRHLNSDTLNMKTNKQLKIGNLNFVSGSTPLQVCSWTNNLELGKALVDCGASVHEKNVHEWSSLHICARQGHLEFLLYLLTHSVGIDEVNHQQNTALHIACKHGNKDVVKALLDANADITNRNINGETCLFITVKFGHFNLVKLLLKYNANPNIVDYQENNCLHACALIPEQKETLYFEDDDEQILDLFKNVEIAKLLLVYGCNLLKRNKIGRTCLHNCAKNNAERLAGLLVSKSHSLINIRDFHGQTALFISCKWKSVDCVRSLMRKNANREIPDLSGMMPIHLSAYEGSEDILSILIEFGDDINMKTIKDKETPLHISVRKNDIKTTEYLIRNHADLNKKNKDDLTSLHLASYYGNLESCRILLNNGAGANISDKTGKSALHWCILGNSIHSVEIAKLLFDFGALINLEDEQHLTPMTHAAIMGNFGILKFFTKKKAKINNSNYESVVHLCALHDKCDPECLKLLIEVYGFKSLFNFSLTNYCTPLQLCVELKSFKFLETMIDCENIECTDWFEVIHSIKGLGVSPLVMAITTQNFKFIYDLIELWHNKFNDLHHFDLRVTNENLRKHGCEKCRTKDYCLFKPNWNNPEHNSEKYFLNILIRENTQLTIEILNTFIKTDTLKWHTYVFLDHLEPYENILDDNVSQFERPLTPLETIYIYDKTELVNHPVVQNLVIEKYKDFGKTKYWVNLTQSISLVVLWTIFAFFEDYSTRHYYDRKNRFNKIILFCLVLLFFIWELSEEIIQIYYVYRRILGFKKFIITKLNSLKSLEKFEDRSKESIVNHIKANEEEFDIDQFPSGFNELNEDDKRLKKIIKDDCFVIKSSQTNRYSLVEKEAKAAKSIPMPYHNVDNLIDWITCSLQFFTIISHFVDLFDHTDVVARVQLFFINFTLIFIWVRQLLNVNSIFPGMKLVCMIRIVFSSIFRYSFIYIRIYLLFFILFWTIYSGSHISESVMLKYWKECEYIQFKIINSELNKSNILNFTNICTPNVKVKGFETFYSSLFTVFRMIIVFSSNYDEMKLIHNEFTPFICSIFTIISSLIGIHFLISLMTNVLSITNKETLKAQESMEFLGYVLENEWQLSKIKRQQHLNRLKNECSPVILAGNRVVLPEAIETKIGKRKSYKKENSYNPIRYYTDNNYLIIKEIQKFQKSVDELKNMISNNCNFLKDN